MAPPQWPLPAIHNARKHPSPPTKFGPGYAQAKRENTGGTRNAIAPPITKYGSVSAQRRASTQNQVPLPGQTTRISPPAIHWPLPPASTAQARPLNAQPRVRPGRLIQRMQADEPMMLVTDEDIDNAEQALNRALDFTNLIHWLRANDKGSQVSNYSVGSTADGDIIISKVGGMGGGGAIIEPLKNYLRANFRNCTVYVAGSFNSRFGSGQHAEMCVVAGARSRGLRLTKVICTEPNCRFCAAELAHLNIMGGTVSEGEPRNQLCWAHPLVNGAFGTGYGASEADSVEALIAFDEHGTAPRPSCGAISGGTPPGGSLTQIFP